MILNTACYDHCPALVDAYRTAGAEFVAHGRTNSQQPNELTEAQERELLRDVYDTIARHEGRPPAGWMSPGANPSALTEDLLAQTGYRYTLDWPIDEQPVWLATRGGPLLSVPYPHEVNDVPAIAFHHASASEFAELVIDTVEELVEQSVRQPLVCGIVAHSFIVGQPHRLRHFRRAIERIGQLHDRLWLTTPGEIAEHYATIEPPPA